MIEISMIHEETIEFVRRIFGVTSGINRSAKVGRNEFHKDVYYLRVTTQDEVRQICETLRPYSITKREQIKLILDFFSLKADFPGRKYDSRSRDILLRMIDVFIELKKRNERGEPPDYEAMRKRLRTKAMKSQLV
jgi:hypothetical protein